MISNSMKAAGVLALVGAASGVQAQAKLDSDGLSSYADVYWYDNGFGYHGAGGTQNYSSNGTDFSDSRNISFTDDGFSGDGSASNTTKYGPSNPGIGGTFNQVKTNMSASSDITASNNNGTHYYESANGSASDSIYFTLSQSTSWSWAADITASSTAGYSNQGGYSFYIYDSGYNTNYAYDSLSSYNGNGNVSNQPVSASGTLPAGSYVMNAQAYAQNFNYQGQGGTGSASVSLDNGVFTIGQVPAPGSAALIGLSGLVASRRRRN